jgi:hypothetical protein
VGVVQVKRQQHRASGALFYQLGLLSCIARSHRYNFFLNSALCCIALSFLAQRRVQTPMFVLLSQPLKQQYMTKKDHS